LPACTARKSRGVDAALLRELAALPTTGYRAGYRTAIFSVAKSSRRFPTKRGPPSEIIPELSAVIDRDELPTNSHMRRTP